MALVEHITHAWKTSPWAHVWMQLPCCTNRAQGLITWHDHDVAMQCQPPCQVSFQQDSWKPSKLDMWHVACTLKSQAPWNQHNLKDTSQVVESSVPSSTNIQHATALMAAALSKSFGTSAVVVVHAYLSMGHSWHLWLCKSFFQDLHTQHPHQSCSDKTCQHWRWCIWSWGLPW